MPQELNRARLLLLLAAAVTVAVYWPGLTGPFVFDDFSNTTEVRLRVLDWQHLGDVAFSNASGPLLRPLANASFALNYYFFGPEPFSYKLVNLLIHLACGFLVFALVRRLLAALKCEENIVLGAAVVTTAVWLLHPLQVSTVLYAVQRMAQLSALFTLMALWAYVAGRTRLAAGNRGGWGFMLLALVVFPLLALGGKENAVLIPVFLLVLEVFVFRFRRPPGRGHRDLQFVWLMGIGLPLVAGCVLLVTHFDLIEATYDLRSFTMFERALTQTRALWLYIYLIFLPLPEHLAFYHDAFGVSRTLDAGVIAAATGLVALLAAMVLLRRRAPVVSLGIAWFFAAHALESSLIGLEMVFEHRNYLALLGPALIVGHGATVLGGRVFSSVLLRRIALLAPVILLAGLTWLQVQRWSSALDFLASHAMNNPESPRATAELAAYFARTGNWNEAERYLDRFEAHLPDDAGAPLMRIHLLCRTDTIDEGTVETAIESMRSAAHAGHLAQKLTLLSRLWLRPGQCPGLRATQLLRILDAALDRPEIRGETAANLHGFRGVILRRLNRDSAAVEAFSRAIELKPDDTDLLFLRAYAELSLRRYEELAETMAMLKQVAAASFRHSEHRIRELERSLAEALALEDALVTLGRSCPGGAWSPADLDRAEDLMETSDAVWVVLPVVARLVATVISAPCAPGSVEQTRQLLEAAGNNSELPDYAPGRAQLWLLHGRLLAGSGEPAQALWAYGKATELAPANFQILHELAYVQLNQGLVAEARATVDMLSSLESAMEPGNDSRIAELREHLKDARE